MEQLRAYWSSPETVYLIVERGKLTEARQVLGSIRPLEDRAIGGNHAYLFANRSSIDP